ncbi:MAG: guanylate kinase [Ruminococcus sp.]|nr:guanylate kinase [Ruminococcus sp.]MDE7225286.1 guanylate kinase [Ruminococcus sp.]
MRRIFYIIGKSSSGKDTIYKELLKKLDLRPIVLYTTRPMRENEIQGREYNFTDFENFYKMKSAGKVIEERIYNTIYGEWAYFTAEGSINSEYDYIGIGTLESYLKLLGRYGKELVPVYIETADDIRLIRAIERERMESIPKYTEMCRRFIADTQDFSEDNLRKAGIKHRFGNNGKIEACISEILEYIESIRKEEK